MSKFWCEGGGGKCFCDAAVGCNFAAEVSCVGTLVAESSA